MRKKKAVLVGVASLLTTYVRIPAACGNAIAVSTVSWCML